MEEKNNLNQRNQTDHDHDNHNNDNDNQNEDATRETTESSVGGCRWNPTKEQIEMLERMYSDEGVRTPSAERIQQITARLRVYGHIEGKNVFYWFQNHKSRQRQKRRQERLVANVNANANVNHSINQFLGHPISGINLHPNPIFPAPSTPTHHNYPYNYFANPNVICSPYYNLPQTSNNNNMGCNPLHSPHYNYNGQSNDQHAIMKRSYMPPGNVVPHGSTLIGYSCASMMKDNNHGLDIDTMMTRTLDLFPVHPTGILEHKFAGMSSTIYSNSPGNSSSGGSSLETNSFIGDDNHRRLFDFFSGGQVSSQTS